MRNWHRLKTFVPLLLAILMAAEAEAQMSNGFPSFGQPAFLAGGNGQGAGFGQGLPQSFQSHPGISPFDNAFEQHFSTDGLWFKKVITALGARNKYYFNVDWVRTKTRGLTGQFGNEDAATWSMLETDDGDAGRFPDALSLNNFNTANVAAIPILENNGIRLSGGIRNPTGWGVAWDAHWASSGQARYDARAGYEAQRLQTIDSLLLESTSGEGLPQTGFSNFNERQFAIDNILTGTDITTALGETWPPLGDADEILDRVLFNLHSIPLLNGPLGPATGTIAEPGGVAQRFDMEFILRHEIESFDTGVHFTWSPIYERGDLTVSPLFGARFIRTDEMFSFFGMDSGLEYEANIPDGIDDDDDFVVDNVAENGDDTFDEGNPFGNAVNSQTPSSLSTSFIDSYVQSKMVGPEVGLSYTYGNDDGLRVIGTTRVGALWNSEKAQLYGNNIGDTLTPIPNPTPDPTNPTDPQDILDDLHDTSSDLNRFSDGKNSSHISPVFRQELTAEIPIFSRVPVLRDIWQLEHAKLRAGFTYLWIGEFADPQQSIVKVANARQFNLFPHLNIKRSSFFQNQFSLGINWEY